MVIQGIYRSIIDIWNILELAIIINCELVKNYHIVLHCYSIFVCVIWGQWVDLQLTYIFYVTTVMVIKTNGPMWTKLVLCDHYYGLKDQRSYVEPNLFYITAVMVIKNNGPMWTKLVLCDQCYGLKDQRSYGDKIWFYVTTCMVIKTNGPMLNQIGSMWPPLKVLWSQRSTVLWW